MKITVKLLMIIALALTTFSQHSVASAGGVFKFKGEGASAIFSSVDASGCVITDVYVNADEGTNQNPPGRGSSSSSLALFISQYDACTGSVLLAADAFTLLADSDFQVFGSLSSATLHARVDAFDYVSNTSFEVFVDLSWDGHGSVNREKRHTHFSSPGCRVNSRFDLTFRPAVATGSVSDGTVNFTPEPSLGYDIYKAKSGDVVIGCN
jgi:hypothetical protein